MMLKYPTKNCVGTHETAKRISPGLSEFLSLDTECGIVCISWKCSHKANRSGGGCDLTIIHTSLNYYFGIVCVKLAQDAVVVLM